MKITIIIPLILLGILTINGCKKDKEGCTNKEAINYDPDATKNDGSCK